VAELKPCPFCGCKGAYVRLTPFSRRYNVWEAYCNRCMANVYHSNRDKAIEMWNRRADIE